MGKWARYGKKYKKEWENLPGFKGWLSSSQKGDSFAFCKICEVDLRAHKNDLLQKHAVCKTHKLNAEKIHVKKRTLTDLGVASILDNKTKLIDLKLAYFVACHTAIQSVDHLGEVLNSFSAHSGISNLRIHHTKCGMLIKKVLAPSILEELLEDVKCEFSKYSLIIDESTDVSDNKYMFVCIRYFSQKYSKVVSNYLGLVELHETTGAEIYKKLTEFISGLNLNTENLVGIGTDGASNLCGLSNSLISRLKIDVPHLIVVRCICHSLHLCSSEASEEIPDKIEFLIRETFNWFSHSPLRKHKYHKLFSVINDNCNPLNLVKICHTRWFSRYGAISRIIDQFLELKTLFSIYSLSEKCYTTKLLADMYKDGSNLLLLIALKPLLKDVTNLNIYFQNNNVDFFKAQDEIENYVRVLIKKVVRNYSSLPENIFDAFNMLEYQENLKELVCISLGYEFELISEELNTNKESLIEIKKVIKNFILKLLTEIKKRIPDNYYLLKKINNFLPTVCLNQLRPDFKELPLELFLKNDDLISKIESQWDMLPLVDWKKQLGQQTLPNDPTEFWIQVYNTKNALGEKKFSELANFALSMLSLPVSNALVERTFSFMNIIKTKTRNKLNSVSLDAIVHIRTDSKAKEICCNKFTPTKAIYSRYNKSIYLENETDDDVIIVENELFL